MLKFTGERYLPFVDPYISGVEIHYEHLHRYFFALEFVKRGKVLDLACGEGYGAYILSKKADYILGLDIDFSVMQYANHKYKKNNLKFLCADMLKMPLKRKIFDVIVCFEALEHIREHNELFVQVKNILKENGVLIISTPNKKVYTDDRNVKNPFHVKELYIDEFRTLLKNNFKYFLLFGQRIFSISNIWPLENSCHECFKEKLIQKTKAGFIPAHPNEKEPEYLIAIASDKPIDISNISIPGYLIDKDNILIKYLYKQLYDLQNQLGNIYNLQGWKLLNKCYRIADKLLPMGSERRKVVERVLKWINKLG